MLTGSKQTAHASQHPSLLVLRAALSMAESAAPARPPRPDTNEQRALQLIARMQANYKKALPFSDVQEVPARYLYGAHAQEMAGGHAR